MADPKNKTEEQVETQDVQEEVETVETTEETADVAPETESAPEPEPEEKPVKGGYEILTDLKYGKEILLPGDRNKLSKIKKAEIEDLLKKNRIRK